MQLGGAHGENPERHVGTGATKPCQQDDEYDQQDAGSNRRSFEVFHFARGVAQLACGDIVAGQAADAASDKKCQDHFIESSVDAECMG